MVSVAIKLKACRSEAKWLNSTMSHSNIIKCGLVFSNASNVLITFFSRNPTRLIDTLVDGVEERAPTPPCSPRVDLLVPDRN